MTDPADRAAGVLVGQAVGDALGVPYEFESRPLTGPARMLGGGLGDYAPGQYSDDTEMAVCIAQVAATGADLTSDAALTGIAHNFAAWRRMNPPDIGNQTRAVLGDGRAMTGAELTERAREYFRRTGRAAGNGGLMRTGIVGLTRLGDREATARAAWSVCELTHADPLAAESCVLWSEAVRVAVVEERFDLAGGLDLVAPDRRAEWAAWIVEAETGPAGRFNPNGFTVTALQAAWAAIRATSGGGAEHVPAALQAAIEIGNDTDTVAAIAGTLLGARYGVSALPTEWLDAVHGWPGEDARSLSEYARATAAAGAPGYAG